MMMDLVFFYNFCNQRLHIRDFIKQVEVYFTSFIFFHINKVKLVKLFSNISWSFEQK